MSKSLFTISAFLLCIAASMLTSVNAHGQTIATPADLYKNGDHLQGTSTDNGSTVFCAESAGFKLTSSTTDPENNLPYTSYVWEEMNTDGNTFSPMTAMAGTGNVLNVPTPTPGWHIYRVTAATAVAAGCEPDPTYYTVYVLPKLKVTPRANKTEAAGISWCSENAAPAGQDAIKFTATVDFETPPRMINGKQLPELTVGQFTKHFAWYKIDPATSAKTPVGTDNFEYTIADPAAPGTATTYKVGVDVTYAITPSAGACNAYAGTALYDGTSTAEAVIKVFKKAGKPTITISNN